MTLEELKSHILYLKERDNEDMDGDKFEMEMEILLKYIDKILKTTMN